MSEFNFQLLDRKGNLKDEVKPSESGTVTHMSKQKIQRGGKIEIHQKLFEPNGAVPFDGTSDFVSVPIDFNKDVITICDNIRLFKGEITEVKAYGRALSKAEIAARYKPVKKSIIRRFFANIEKVIKYL